MDLGYNKEIELSEVTFPEGFIFQKTEEHLYLESSWCQRVIVTSSGIKVISFTKSLLTEKEQNLESFFIERDNISDFSIKTYFINERRSPDAGIPLYKIIIHLKNSKRLELLGKERFKSKLIAFFLIQEVSKKLNLSIKNSSSTEERLDAPNFCNIDVVKNDNQNLVIKKDSKFTYTYNDFIIRIYVNLFALIGVIALFVMSFYGIQNLLSHGIDFNFIYLAVGYVFFIFILLFCLSTLYTSYNGYYKGEGQGLYLSITPYQISIATSAQTHIKDIELDQNVTIGIAQVISLVNSNENLQNDFEVVLSKKNDFNSKTFKKVLVDEITQSEAEYIIKKIFYLSNQNNKAKLTFDNHIKIKLKFFKVIAFIVFGICCSVALSYITYALAKALL